MKRYSLILLSIFFLCVGCARTPMPVVTATLTPTLEYTQTVPPPPEFPPSPMPLPKETAISAGAPTSDRSLQPISSSEITDLVIDPFTPTTLYGD